MSFVGKKLPIFVASVLWFSFPWVGSIHIFVEGILISRFLGSHGWKSRHVSGVQKALCGNSAVLAKDGWCVVS